jgi:antitoxin ParD1/3/4
MATMNISLPDQMKEWVEREVANGRYSNVSDYIRDLIREDQDKSARVFAELRALGEAGIASGVSDRTPEEIRQATRAEFSKKGRRLAV